jgi:hypothetical protein
MKTMIAGLVISMAVALIPPPRITVDNPKLLFAAAMYKTAIGDTQSALRLMQRAEQARQSTRTLPRNTLQTASGRSTLATIL